MRKFDHAMATTLLKRVRYRDKKQRNEAQKVGSTKSVQLRLTHQSVAVMAPYSMILSNHAYFSLFIPDSHWHRLDYLGIIRPGWAGGSGCGRA
jgi:hypothetical protein